MSKSVPKRQYPVNHSCEGAARTAAGDAFSAFVVQLFRLHGLLVEAGDALAKPAGQTSARWQVLAAVDDAPATVAQIARALSLARQSVQRVADLLTQEGLTSYEDNPAHRRAKLLRLTAPGRSVLRAIQAAQRPWADALGTEIGEADLRQASVVLERALRTVGSRPPPGR